MFPSVTHPQTSEVWQQSGCGVLVYVGFPSSTLPSQNTDLSRSWGYERVGFSDGFFAGGWF